MAQTYEPRFYQTSNPGSLFCLHIYSRDVGL